MWVHVSLKITLWKYLLRLPAFRRNIPPQSWRYNGTRKVSVITDKFVRRHITETPDLNIRVLPSYTINYQISHAQSRNAQVAQSLQWTCCDMADLRLTSRNCTSHFHPVTSLECVETHTPPAFNMWCSVTHVLNIVSNGIRTRDERIDTCSYSVSELTHQ